MTKIKFTKFTNNKGQMVWLADDLSGRSIIRSKNFMGWLYEVAVITSYGNRITATALQLHLIHWMKQSSTLQRCVTNAVNNTQAWT